MLYVLVINYGVRKEGGRGKGGFQALPNFGTAKRSVFATKTQSRFASDVADTVLGPRAAQSTPDGVLVSL